MCHVRQATEIVRTETGAIDYRHYNRRARHLRAVAFQGWLGFVRGRNRQG
ncbi:MAG: hypothetical protein VX339_11600 [Pseudomonadota bacterium]|nr:hypothetical protein [Pseudomonadota bacterium]MEE3118741.1 hypothetical protein [Pseudomonadota bacterium]